MELTRRAFVRNLSAAVVPTVGTKTILGTIALSSSVTAAFGQQGPPGGGYALPRDTPPPEPSSFSVPLKLQSLVCGHTTEAGADEVYILVYSSNGQGKATLRRFPSDAPGQSNGHWDMNDGDQPVDNPSGDSHAITSKTLGTYSYTPGETLEITIFVMEEDGGSSRKYQEAAAALAQKIPNPIAQGAGAVLGALTELGLWANDTDDYIGSVSLRFETVMQVGYKYTWIRGDRIASGAPDNAELIPDVTYQMNGDGSRYSARFSCV